MSLLEFEPNLQPADPIISVGMNISERYEYGGPLPHLFIDGVDKGVIDWVIANGGDHAYIDGLDAENELKVKHLRKLAWGVIANCLHGMHPALETVDFPDSRQEVLRPAA